MTRFLAPRARLILMIGDDGIATVPYHIPNAVPFYTPHDSKNGVQEISAFLARHPTAPLTLFVDNLTQDYRSDILPRLNMFDRAKLARRRLKQTFPAARLIASLNVKKSRNQILLIGLHESNPAFAWAERLQRRLPVIALLPVEGARLMNKLMPESKTGWAMMIGKHKTGGFRQIVTLNGNLVFTRLTPLPPPESHEDANIIARDIKASLDYLGRHGLRQASNLSVLLLLPDDIHAETCFAALSLKSLASMSPFAAAQKLNLPFAPQPADDTSDLLFAAALAAQRPVLSLMLPQARQMRETQTLSYWGLRLASLTMLFAVGHMIWSAGALASTLLQDRKQSAQLEQTRQTLAQAQMSAAPLTEPLGRLRQAIERRRIYDQPTPTPWQGLNELAGGLNKDVKIVRLNWKKDSDAVPELFSVALRAAPPSATDDRAETVAAFTQATQNISHAMPDYNVAIAHTPFPDMPQDSVTASATSTDPIGEITLQRKTP